MNPDLIDKYENGGERLKMAIRGLIHEDFNAYPVPGTWSIRQIVVHLADSDLVSADRMKRVIAEDNPTLLAFDENKWTKGLHYELQSAEDAAELLALNRKQFASVLRVLPSEAFARTGTHTERGVLTLAQLLEITVNHLDHHLTFVRDKREKLGKLMW